MKLALETWALVNNNVMIVYAGPSLILYVVVHHNMHFKTTRVRVLFPSVYSINESPVKVFIVMNINAGLSKDPRDPILYV